MPVLRCYVDDNTMRRLRHSAHLYGTTVEALAEIERLDRAAAKQQ